MLGAKQDHVVQGHLMGPFYPTLRYEIPTAPLLPEVDMAARVGDRPPILYDWRSMSDRPLISDRPSTSDRPSLSTHPSMTDQDHHECSCSCSCFYRRRVGQQRPSCCKEKCIIIALVISFVFNFIIAGGVCYLSFWYNLPQPKPEMQRAPVDASLICLGQARERTLLLFPGTQKSSFRNNATCVTSDWMHDLAAEAIWSKSCDYTAGKDLTAPFATVQPSALLFLHASQISETRLAWRPYFSSMTLSNNALTVDTPGRYFVISVLAHPTHAGAYRSHWIDRQRNTGSSDAVLMTKDCQGVGGVGGCSGPGKEGPVSILVGVLRLEAGDSISVNVSDLHAVCRNSYGTFLGVWKV